MELLNFLMAIAALLIPLLFAWVVVTYLANKHPEKQERKSSK
ncbi:hypothetical protein [Thiobacillus sp.]|nr:hypothetical protein [Thiobacillus sp.]